ncbi:phage portal protein [Enterococcus lactis]|uniref:phage portal protein n=1 Tax=Enterococcus lactis TaxID=357441 RepID=UPI0022E3C8EB|nr:phage portal protein [Enterococcus lactis]
MDLEKFKSILKPLVDKQTKKNKEIETAEKYYQNENDIETKVDPAKLADTGENPLRVADNRVSHNWHQLLLDQKAGYGFTVPPLFDVDDKELNRQIVQILGDSYPKKAKRLCVNAGNAGIAYLHIWVDDDGLFRYAPVDSKQCIPIYEDSLDERLKGFIRNYGMTDEEGEQWIVYEYWDEKEVIRTKTKGKIEELQLFQSFNLVDPDTKEVKGKSEKVKHYFADAKLVPFIPFANNEFHTSDLNKVKKHIDVYDKVYSGFVNDLDDIQQLVLVVTNYSGTNPDEFRENLKRYKLVKVEQKQGQSGSGVDTMAIEIPIEARDKLLEMTREQIFVSGQGVNPIKELGANSSGVAIKQLYSLLELKMGMLETEFRIGFAQLLRFILYYLHVEDAKTRTIKQTWTRTAIDNDLEQAEIVSKVMTATSQENIAKSNPIVEDWEAELKALAKEKEENFRAEDDYRSENPLADPADKKKEEIVDE